MAGWPAVILVLALAQPAFAQDDDAQTEGDDRPVAFEEQVVVTAS